MNTKVSCNNNSMVKKDTAYAIGNCFPFFLLTYFEYQSSFKKY